MRTNDQESIFAGKEPRVNPIAFYFAIQLLPYLAFILFLLFHIPILHITIIILILIGINFWFIKNVNGMQLVGLRWKLSFSNGFEYYSKPNPFVPRAIDSNSFWIGFFVFIILWIIAFIISIFLTSTFLCIVCLIGFLSEFINLNMFMRSHKSAKNQAEHAALEILQDEKVNFELVHSDDEENRNDNNNGNDQIDANTSDKSNNIDDDNHINIDKDNNSNENHDFYPDEPQNENNNNDNGNEEFNLPTFDIPDDNEVNFDNNEEEPVHFELVDDKDD